MSILARLKQAPPEAGKKLFAVIAGPRLGGKTTLAGTLPGRTYLLQAAVLESGCESAKALAAKLGNELWVESFTSIEDLVKKLTDLKTDTDFDHVVIDGISAVTEMKHDEPKIVAKMKSDNWGAFRDIGDTAKAVLRQAKELTYPEKVKSAKNVFVTCALKVKVEGTAVDVELESKGRVAVTEITKLGEAVLTVLPSVRTENGETGHRLLTKSVDQWPGRIDGLLAEQNPGIIEPASLATVLKLKNGDKK